MTYFEVKNGHVLKRPEKGVGIDENYIVDPAQNPVVARIQAMCAHYGFHSFACDPDQSSGRLTHRSCVVSWDGDDLDLYLPNMGFRDAIDRESVADDLTTWLEAAEELERLFQNFDDPAVLGPPSLSVTFEGEEIRVKAYRRHTVLGEFVSLKPRWFKPLPSPLSGQMNDWAETLITNLRNEDTSAYRQIVVREDDEALYLPGWVLPVKSTELPDQFPGRPALRTVRQGLSDLVREIDPKETP